MFKLIVKTFLAIIFLVKQQETIAQVVLNKENLAS
jgi:hypothetical protein